jgi:hypothetical protein
MKAALSRLLAGSLLAAQLGCSLMYADDADRTQCDSDADCRKRTGDDRLMCVKPEGVCNYTDDTSESVACSQNAECPQGQQCGFDGVCYEKWGCLDDDPDWPEADDSFTFSGPLVSLTNPADPSLLGDSIEVLACSAGDPNCASPLATGQVDGDNNLSVRFTSFRDVQFNGFIRIRDSSASDVDSAAFLPAFVHYGSQSRLVSSLPLQTRIFLVNPAAYGTLASLAGVSDADPGAGTVIFIVQDCGGRLAAQVSMKPEGTSSYEFLAVQGGNQPVPDAEATTADGAGLMLNIPPDEARTFVLKDEDSGREIDRVTLNVRGRATNYVFYYPRYSALTRWLAEHERQTQDSD